MEPIEGANLSTENIQEIGITIYAKNLNPTMLTQDFLKLSGIIDNDWELAKKPILSPRGSQISFKNGVNIVAQPNTINFIEAIRNKEIKQLQAPAIAQKYVDKLPNAEYQGLSTSPKSIITLNTRPDAARNYIVETLLAPGSWLNFGKAPVQAGINFSYQLERCQFSLNINEARLRQTEKQTISAILFAGNFNYNIVNSQPDERLPLLVKLINNWETDWQTFQELITQKFLVQAPQLEESVFPGMM